MAAKLKAVEKKPDSMYSPLALTLSAEIKRMSIEKALSIGEIIEKLSGFTGVSERHIYDYRSGKTDIPALLIPVFCKQFESNALAMALVGLCDTHDFEGRDALDLIQFCSQTLGDMLKGGQVFNEVVADGRVDGHELLEVKNVGAAIVRNAHRMIEIATQIREGSQCAA